MRTVTFRKSFAAMIAVASLAFCSSAYAITYSFIPGVAPNCTKAGHIPFLMGSDGNYYDRETTNRLDQAQIEIHPLGHDWGAWTTNTPPTCISEGSGTHTCTRCSETATETIPALGHDWTAWTVVAPATYFCAGEEARDCSRCNTHETREIPMRQHSTFTVTSSSSHGSNTVTITRSNTTETETVHYRTVSMSAYADQHFYSRSGQLTFTSGIATRTVTILPKTPPSSAFRFQNQSMRGYDFEVTDEGGFLLASVYCGIQTGTSIPDEKIISRLNKAVTNLVYFTDAGALSSGVRITSDKKKYTDVAHSGSSGAYVKVTNDGYNQAVHTVSTSSLFPANANVRTYLDQCGVKLYATVYFTQKEEQDGCQYIQILADNATTCDGKDPERDINGNDPSVSLYKACFTLSCDPAGSVMEDNHYQFFPHRYGYVDKAAEKAANPKLKQYSFDYDNSHLYRQKFKNDSYLADASGSLVLPVTVDNLNIRFDAAGSGGGDWYFKDLKVRFALVDSVAPALLRLSGRPYITVAPGIRAKGNDVYVSLAFDECVTYSGTLKLRTSWGELECVAGRTSNVLTFTGKIAMDASDSLSIIGKSGTINDFAGNVFNGSVAADNLATLSPSHDYSILYDLAGGALPDGTDNPATYNYTTPSFTLANPVRQGYEFAGWSGTGISGTNKTVVVAEEHGDRVYSAHWNRAYPAYLYEADDEVLANYDDWAERYGHDALGENEAAFLLDVAPDAVTNGVTMLKIVELGATNVLYQGSVYQMFMEGASMVQYGEEYLPCHRFAVESDAGALMPGPWREYSQDEVCDICNGYIMLNVSHDLALPRSEWLKFSWFVDYEGDRAIVTMPDMFIEGTRRYFEFNSSKPVGGLFLSIGIEPVMRTDSFEIFDLLVPVPQQDE